MTVIASKGLRRGWVVIVAAAFVSAGTVHGAGLGNWGQTTPTLKICLAKLPSSLGSDGIAIDSLATQVVSDYLALPTTTSADDVEASVVFAVSQAKLSTDGAVAGLERAAQCADAKLLAAIKKVIATLKSGKLKTGTGSISTGNGISGFTLPIVEIGGGSSNYSGS